MRRSLASRIVTGLLFVLIGILVLGQVAGFWDVGNLAQSWWTLFIIVPAIAGIISSGVHFWNVFLLFLGCFLLAEDQNWLHGNAWPFFLGAFLIFFGFWVILGGHHHHYHGDHDDRDDHDDHDDHDHHGTSHSFNMNEDSNDFPEYNAIFSNIAYRNGSKTFRGGKASSVFGGLTVDLRDIGVTGNCVIEVAAVFGGLEVLAPKDVPVRINVTPVFGALYTGTSVHTSSSGGPYLEIRGASVFGSVRIV